MTSRPRPARRARPALEPLEARLAPAVISADDRHEDNDTPARATALGTLTGTRALYGLKLMDSADWFKFTTVAKGSLLDQVILEYAQADGNLDLELYDAHGQEVGRSSDKGGYEDVKMNDLPAGTYFVKVFGVNGAKNPAYDLFVQAPMRPIPDDPYENNDSFDQAFSLGVVQGSKAVQNLNLEDSADWFSFTTLAKGTSKNYVAFHFDSKAADLGLKLYNAQGQAVGSSNGAGAAERVSLDGLPAGVYFAEVTSTFGNSLAGTYSLAVCAPEAGDDAHEDNDNYKDASPLGWLLQKTTVNDLKLNDKADWFSFYLDAPGAKAGATASVKTTSGGGALTLDLCRPDGRVIRSGKASGDTATVSLNGLDAGVAYRLKVHRAGSAPAGAADYELTIDPPRVTNWYAQNLGDKTLRKLVELSMRDGLLSRGDVLSLFEVVARDGTVSRAEFRDLSMVVRNPTTIQMPDFVRSLARNVVGSNHANKVYQGKPLGDLKPGAKAGQLEKLVGKWFLGLERPGTQPLNSQSSNINYSPFFYFEGTPFGGMARITPSAYPDVPQYYVLPTPPLPSSPTPLPTDIHQGDLGDCYFLSTLASTAQQDPSHIQNLFVDESDGVFTVRLFVQKDDGLHHPVYVTVDKFLPLDTRGLSNTDWTPVYANAGVNPGINGNNNVLWAALMEKAYAILNQTGELRRTGEGALNRFRYQGINSGYAQQVMSQLYGQAAVSHGSDKLKSLTFAEVRRVFDAGSPVVFGTKGKSKHMTDPEAVATSHDYGMLGYDEQTEEVILLNPWGVGTSHDKPPSLKVNLDFIRGNYDAYYHLDV
jgi:hypothetical protein